METRTTGGRKSALRPLGFTLVELLVVIGIIAVLISILLPALAKVRRQAQGTQCLSNLRVLGQAAMLFSNENNGWMPARAAGGSNNENYYNQYTKFLSKSGMATYYNMSDWIAFESYVDPYGTVAGQDENLTYSGLAKYLNIQNITSQAKGAPAPTFDSPPPGGFPDSAAINAKYAKYFLCPGDDPAQRPGCDPAKQPYRYSYQLSEFVCSPAQSAGGYTANTKTGTCQRIDFLFNGKLASINNPSNILMFVCADEFTIGWNSTWKGDPTYWSAGLKGNPPAPQTPLISSRHYSTSSSVSMNAQNANAPNTDGLGNACFCDGHAEAIGRKESLRGIHTGSAAPDPVGF